MQLTQIQDGGNTLLTYSLMTTPSPVQVSASAAQPSVAMITFAVSCPRAVGTATVAQIILALPVDDAKKPQDPTNLAAVAPPVSAASISSSSKQEEWIPSAGQGPGVFIFTPKGGPVQVSSQGLTIVISGLQVNTLVGTALVKIMEWAAKGDAQPPATNQPPSGRVTVEVPKFPYQFFAGDFVSDRPLIQNGDRPTLSWKGSTNATYKMLWDKNTLDVSNIRTWSPTSDPPSPALTETTPFILEIRHQEGGQSVPYYLGLTVVVANPSLHARDLTVANASTLQGAVTIGREQAPAPLTVSGPAVVAAGLTAKQGLTVDGPVTANHGITATGGFTVSGGVTADGLTANGGVTANHGLTVNNGLTANGGATISGVMTLKGGDLHAFGLRGLFTQVLVVDANGQWFKDCWIGAYGDAAKMYLHVGGVTSADGVRRTMLVNNKTLIAGDVEIQGNLWVTPAGQRAGVDMKQVYSWGNNYACFQQAPFDTPSDLRLKSDVQPIPSAVDKVHRLRGVSYRWTGDALRHFTRDIESSVSAGLDATEEQQERAWDAERERRYKSLDVPNIGVVAQDVEAVLPEAVKTDEAGYKSVQYHQLTPLLIEALKELDETIKAQGRLLAQQQAAIDRLLQAQRDEQPRSAQTARPEGVRDVE